MRFWRGALSAVLLTGCGAQTALLESDMEAGAGSLVHEGTGCLTRPTLLLDFGGSLLETDLPAARLAAGQWLAPASADLLALSNEEWARVKEEVERNVAAIFAPFDIEVAIADVGEDARPLPAEAAGSIVSRIFIVRSADAVQNCACQGMTPKLGVAAGETATAYVFADAFMLNGLVPALQRRGNDPAAGLAVAIANTAAHEAGHTLGLVHVETGDGPRTLMARGDDAGLKLTVSQFTTLQFFSEETLPTPRDAQGIRGGQCCACVIQETLAAYCGGTTADPALSAKGRTY